MHKKEPGGLGRDEKGLGGMVTIILYSNAQMHGQRYANVATVGQARVK